MSEIHYWVGLVVPAAFLVIFFWGVASWIRNRDPGDWFWRVLALGQLGLGALALTGGVLLALGGRRPWLHYAYGIFPVLVLVVAYRLARRFEGLEWAVFAVAGLVNFGLLVRGFMTGIGL